MKVRVLPSLVLLVPILVIVSAVVLKKQYKTGTLIVNRVDRRKHLEPYPFYGDFVDEDGRMLSLSRTHLTDSDEVWAKLQEGQELLLDHRLIYWQLGKKRFTLYHRDKLINLNP